MLVWMFRPNNHKKNPMHKPGIEPGSIAWQATILPLDHLCLCIILKFLAYLFIQIYIYYNILL